MPIGMGYNLSDQGKNDTGKMRGVCILCQIDLHKAGLFFFFNAFLLIHADVSFVFGGR